MLQNIREKSVGTGGKILLAVILVLLAGTGLNYTILPKQFVAKVEGEEISLRDVRNAFLNQIRQYGDLELPDAFVDQLRASAVESVIDDTVLRRYLDDQGLAVSDAAVGKAIVEDPQFRTDGRFDRELYDRLLASNQLSVAGYERDRRRSMIVSQFQQTLIESEFVTPAEFRKRVELSGQQREVEIATIDPNTFIEEVTIGDDEIAAWYENNPDRFVTEAQVHLDYVLIDENLARDRIVVEEDTLREYYEGIRDQYQGEEQRRARHVLLDAGDRELAETVLSRIEAGESFEELAAEFSIDGASSRRGGDLGFVARGDFVGPVEEAVFAMQPGELSGIVASEFGLHILKLDEIRPAEPPSFEEVRDDIADRYYSERVGGELAAMRDTLDDQYFENAGLEQMAQSLGTDVRTVESYTASSVVPFGNEPTLSEVLFGEAALDAGQLSEPISLSGDRTLVVRVAQSTPAGRQPLADVADDVREILTNRAANDIANERGAQLAGALRAEPTMDFDTLVLNSGATASEKRYIARNEPSVPAALAAAVFDAPRPSPNAPVVGSVSVPGEGYLIYRVSAVRAGTVPEELSQAQLDAQRRQLAAQTGTSAVIAIRAALRDKADVQMGDLLEAAQNQ